jgi:diguanylate cyclase (GGDEF)-like protein
MASRAEHKTARQPGNHGAAIPSGGDGVSLPRARTPELPAVGMDVIAAAVLVCAPDGTVLDINRPAAGLLGIDPEAAMGRPMREIRQWAGTWISETGEEIEPAASTVARLAFTGRRVDGEVVGVGDPGECPSLWLRISAEPLLSPAGELEVVVLTLVDVTHLKTTRDALHDALSELGGLIETLPDTYLYLDADDVVQRVIGERHSGPGVPGLLTGDGVGAPVWESLSEDAAARIRKAAALARATHKPVTAEIATVTPTTTRYDEVRHVPREGGTLLLIVRDITESRRAAEALRHDPVTGLANRALLEDRMGQAVKHAARKRLAFSVAVCRIDRFDTVDSSLGRDETEHLLEELGRRLQHAGRAEDTLAYLGGGSLAALLPGAAGPAETAAAVGAILAAVSEPFLVTEHELFLSLSVGIAIYPSDGATAAELLGNADAAMRRASDEGGDRWEFFHSGMNAERRDRLALDAELHRALDAGQFFLEYQPVVSTTTEEIVAVEALVRWRHPERGIVPPLDFIPVAEESGVLIPMGAWILSEACRQGRAWQRRFGAPLRMSVNISARQLHEETLVDTVRRTLRATGFDARSLELEITETAAMRDARHTAQILGALRAMGVRVALDDFGTGYSSLSHLVRLPVSTVKIDRSFVRDLLTVPEHAAVAASVIALGHRLGLTVVAEGVETIGERGVLRDEGCDEIQGFLYSRPLAAEECAALLAVRTIRL